jgi:hypothetical protein
MSCPFAAGSKPGNARKTQFAVRVDWRPGWWRGIVHNVERIANDLRILNFTSEMGLGNPLICERNEITTKSCRQYFSISGGQGGRGRRAAFYPAGSTDLSAPARPASVRRTLSGGRTAASGKNAAGFRRTHVQPILDGSVRSRSPDVTGALTSNDVIRILLETPASRPAIAKLIGRIHDQDNAAEGLSKARSIARYFFALLDASFYLVFYWRRRSEI